MPPHPQAPARQRVLTSATPRIADIVFYERHDSRLAENAVGSSRREYNKPHPAQSQFPGHKLAFIEPDDEKGWEKWWYVADRESQDEYNFETSYPYNGLKEFPRYKRTYIIAREDYEALEKGTADPTHTDAKLLFERQVRTGERQLDNLYVVVEREYDHVPDAQQQNLHNFETTYPYGGLEDFPRRTRTYILPRQDYTPLAPDTADPQYPEAKLIDEDQRNLQDPKLDTLYVQVVRTYDEVPSISEQDAYNAEYTYPYNGNEDYPRTSRKYVVRRDALATTTFPAADPDDPNAFYAFRRVDRFEDSPLDSLYLSVTVNYDRVPNLTDLTDEAFLESFGFSVTRPYGDVATPTLTWRIPLPKSESFALTANYTPCPITGYTGLLLTGEQMENPPDNAAAVAIVRVYSSLPGPDLDSTTVETFPQVPRGFIAEQTTTVSRIPSENTATPEVVDGAITGPGGARVRSSVGADGNNKLVYNKGAVTLEATLGPLEGEELDPETNTLLPYTREIVPAGTSGSVADVNGEFSEVQPLNQEFSIKTTRKSTGLADGSITYENIVDYAWPPVLTDLSFHVIESKGDGSPYTSKIGYNYYMKSGYSGPCKASITESWSVTPVVLSSPAYMIPEQMSANFILLTRFHIPPCLHTAVSLTETVGSAHPIYSLSTLSISFAATNYTDWPATIVARDTQAPYKNGYKRRTVTVYKPGT